MATKTIKFGQEARLIVKRGMDIVGNAVRISLGVQGRTCIIGKNLTKDGYSIVKSIHLTDPLEKIGADLIREVAFKTVKEGGDNTSTATLLAQEIYSQGIEIIGAKPKWWQFWKSNRMVNSVEVKNGIDKSVSFVIDSLREMSKPIEINSPKLKQIATISANNDEEIGTTVSDAIQKTGKHGVVTLDNSQTGKTYIKLTEGLQFERSYLSPYFINDHENLSCQLDNPYIIVCEGKISTKNEIFPIFNKIVEEAKANGAAKAILIIAEDVDQEAISIIITNRIKAQYPICVVKAPGFGDNQKQQLKDIAIIVGANVANEESGLRMDLLKLSDLGTAEKVLVGKDETTIVGGAGKKIDIDAHINYVTKAIELSSNDYEREQNEKRLAKLLGGVGIIFVGAQTDVEVNEKKDRFDDALRASKCAIEEGVLPGGGIALLQCIKGLDNLATNSVDEKSGVKLIQEVLKAPFLQMVENAGLGNKVSISSVLNGSKTFGYNFKTNKYEDLFISGVLDATKVVISALRNASSVSGTLLTSEAVLINEEPQIPFNNPLMNR